MCPPSGWPSPVLDHLLEEFVAERRHADEFAVVGREPIVREVEGAHDADDRGFLPGERRDRGDLALPLEVPEALRRPAGEEHVGHEMTVELGVGLDERSSADVPATARVFVIASFRSWALRARAAWPRLAAPHDTYGAVARL